MLSYYGTPGVRETCHALKQSEDPVARQQAIHTIAEYLTGRRIVSSADYLVPAPQHNGIAEYTKEIADLVAGETGCTVVNILRCKPHVPLYDAKIRGNHIGLHMYLVGELPENGKLFFVDNVLATGQTYREANRVCGGRLIPLVYAIDETLEENKK